MKEFSKLGAIIRQRWQAVSYDENLFPEIAADGLREADLPSKLTAWDVAQWALRETTLPVQHDLTARFGEPPLTVFHSARFRIDIYFWLQSTTAIHQHGFCGAFQVLLGGSLHSHYNFQQHERINFHCATGKIELNSAQWLKPGEIKAITAGANYIHALFHLDNPSATIVVRTNNLPLAQPQFEYLKPNLALDSYFEDADFARKKQLALMLVKAGKPESENLIAEFLQTLDFHTTIDALLLLHRALNFAANKDAPAAVRAREQFSRLLEIAARRHTALCEILPPVFEQQEREFEIVKRRDFVTNPNHRYFLALLMNLDGSANILPLVKERAPEQNAIETVLDWIDELGRTRIQGTNENALGIADYNDDYAFVLEGMLQNRQPKDIAAKIKSELPASYAAELTPKIGNYYQTLKNSPIFQPFWK
jgi:hypothetical protein